MSYLAVNISPIKNEMKLISKDTKVRSL